MRRSGSSKARQVGSREGYRVSGLLTVKKSDIYGKGCFALTHFPARKKITLYEGELIKGSTKIQALIRQQAATAIKVITIDADTAIDGAVGGNETAFMNHSC